MNSKKGIFEEFLEKIEQDQQDGQLTRNESAHPLFLMERENRLWERKLDAWEVRMQQVVENRIWEDFLVHLEELNLLKNHYEKVQHLFSYAEPVAEQLYMQHLIRSEQEEILEMIREISEESFVLGKSTIEKSLFLEHLFLRIRQGISREETRLFEDLRAYVEPHIWQSIYYELLDMGFLFDDIPEYFKEEGTFFSDDLTIEQLQAAMYVLDIPISLRGADGRRLLRMGKFPMSDEVNDSGLMYAEKALEEGWHTQMADVGDLTIRYVSLRDEHGKWIGLLEVLEEK